MTYIIGAILAVYLFGRLGAFLFFCLTVWIANQECKQQNN